MDRIQHEKIDAILMQMGIELCEIHLKILELEKENKVLKERLLCLESEYVYSYNDEFY